MRRTGHAPSDPTALPGRGAPFRGSRVPSKRKPRQRHGGLAQLVRSGHEISGRSGQRSRKQSKRRNLHCPIA